MRTGKSAMDNDRSPAKAASSSASHDRAVAVAEVLATIEELAPQLERVQGVLAVAARRLAKPSRAELVGMRDIRHPVTPEAFLLGLLHLASMSVESAWSWLESVDSASLVALDEAFARGEFPTDLVQFRDLARGAGQEELVGRESLEAAVAMEQASAPACSEPQELGEPSGY